MCAVCVCRSLRDETPSQDGLFLGKYTHTRGKSNYEIPFGSIFRIFKLQQGGVVLNIKQTYTHPCCDCLNPQTKFGSEL